MLLNPFTQRQLISGSPLINKIQTNWPTFSLDQELSTIYWPHGDIYIWVLCISPVKMESVRSPVYLPRQMDPGPCLYWWIWQLLMDTRLRGFTCTNRCSGIKCSWSTINTECRAVFGSFHQYMWSGPPICLGNKHLIALHSPAGRYWCGCQHILIYLLQVMWRYVW